MLMLYPLIVIALLCWWLRLERRAQAAWREHPDRPWNVQIRAGDDAMRFQQDEHARRALAHQMRNTT